MDSFEQELMNKDKELVDLLTQVIQNQRANNKALVRVIIVVSICYTLVVGSMVGAFMWRESQYDYTETYTYSEEVEQEASGENSTINNVNGNQYNDSAVHNEGD